MNTKLCDNCHEKQRFVKASEASIFYAEYVKGIDVYVGVSVSTDADLCEDCQEKVLKGVRTLLK